MTPSTYAVLARVSPGYPPLLGRLPTCYSPVRRSPETEASFAHDLHVLSTPPAFILSQDQTLQFRSYRLPGGLTPDRLFFRNRFQLNCTHPKGAGTEPGSRPLTSLFLYLVFKEPTPRLRLAPLRADLVSEGRRSIGQAGPGVNPSAPPRFVVRRDVQPFA